MERLGPFEEHLMPNGSVVYYRDSDHTYHSEVTEKKGKWSGKGRWGDLPSPSQIAKFADPNPDKLMGYAAKKTLEGVMALGNIESCADVGDLEAQLKERNFTWRQMRDAKGDLGTTAHKLFENILSLNGDRRVVGFVGHDFPALAEPGGGYARGILEFFTEIESWTTLQSEAVVYSSEHGYAGRFDTRIRVPVKGPKIDRGTTGFERWVKDETWLIDLKTSNYIGRSAHNQLVGYDIAAEESGYGHSDKLFILQVFPEPGPDGKYYHLWPCRGTRDGFLGNLLSYRDGKRLDKEMNADYKVWRET